jgi:hypothetical protein
MAGGVATYPWTSFITDANVANLDDEIGNANEVPKGPEEEQANQIHWCDSAYTINAPRITLVSTPDPLTLVEPVGILLQATGLEGTDGEVCVFGTGKACLIGGAQASVVCVTEEEVTGTVTIDCGPVGTIALQSGLAQEPNLVSLNPEGILLQSLLEVKATVEENSVTLNPAMISLQSGPSSISITPEGITLTCGPCSIALTMEGIVISGPTVEVSGDAAVTVSGAAITIGP